MATLALSSIGSALGGPIGSVIGGLIGQTIDKSLFGPGPRHGPRLNDLSVQTSSYGTQIPRIYGAMRVAGSVIWATELKESSEPHSGGKGQPDTIVYGYSASFAVALSSRAANGVGRIWADGKLLRGMAGDFKVKTGFRFYPGDEDQAIDPLIASVEGIDRAPAFRGVALAVFEDLQLAEFGNRIPFLTFEVLGDAIDPTIGAIIADASEGLIQSDAPERVRGYAAYGASRIAAVRPIVEQLAVPLFDDGELLRTPLAVTNAPGADELGCGAGIEGIPRSERVQTSARDLPCTLALSYYDPSRDYQSGQLRASSAASRGTDETVELPASISASQAKAIAENHIARRWAQRDKLVVRLPPEHLSVEPGSLMRTPDGSVWCVEQATLEEMVVRLQLSAVSGGIANAPADGGQHLPPADVVATPTVLALLDLPDLAIGRHDVPIIHIAACQPTAGWRPIPVEVASGGTIRTIASARSEAVVGQARSVLGVGPATIFDLINSVEVELADTERWLENRDNDALANGANLAVLGKEVFQFGTVTPLGGNRVRLSRLLRGRRGSEWAMAGHAPGEKFVLLDANALRAVELGLEALGTSIAVRAAGVADAQADPTHMQVGGEALQPPSPVHLRVGRTESGDVRAIWRRRSRAGWAWLDGLDAPLGESTERYRAKLEGPSGSIVADTTAAELAIPSSQLETLGTGPLSFSVVQVGDYAESRPAAAIIN